MIATLFSLFAATAILLLPEGRSAAFHVGGSLLLAIIPFVLLSLQLLFFALSLAPLQKLEKNLTSKVISLYLYDRYWRLTYGVLFFFALFSLLLFASQHSINLGDVAASLGLAAWLLLLGVSSDLIYATIRRTFTYFNPLSVIDMAASQARQCVVQDREIDLCNWVDALTEIATKAVQRRSSSLCNRVVIEIGEIERIFLESSKSIAHEQIDAQSRKLGIRDKISYTLYYILERIELLYKQTLAVGDESVCGTIITTLGKIVFYAAQCDLSLVTYSAYLIGKLSRQAQGERLGDIAIKGSCTLLETFKQIIDKIDLTYMELQEPFNSIFTQIDQIAKESFRQNKNSSLSALTQPLMEIKSLLQSEKLKEHRDIPDLIKQIDSLLAEWQNLETVMRTIPPISVTPPNE